MARRVKKLTGTLGCGCGPSASANRARKAVFAAIDVDRDAKVSLPEFLAALKADKMVTTMRMVCKRWMRMGTQDQVLHKWMLQMEMDEEIAYYVEKGVAPFQDDKAAAGLSGLGGDDD